MSPGGVTHQPPPGARCWQALAVESPEGNLYCCPHRETVLLTMLGSSCQWYRLGLSRAVGKGAREMAETAGGRRPLWPRRELRYPASALTADLRMDGWWSRSGSWDVLDGRALLRWRAPDSSAGRSHRWAGIKSPTFIHLRGNAGSGCRPRHEYGLVGALVGLDATWGLRAEMPTRWAASADACARPWVLQPCQNFSHLSVALLILL